PAPLALHSFPTRRSSDLVEQADGLDVLGQPLNAQGMDGLGGVGHREQLVGGLVDAHVGSLGGKDYRDQQFEGSAVVQLGGRVRVVIPQPAEDLVTLGFVHYQLMVPVTRTRLLPAAAGASRRWAWRALI